jgi:hypothetical protein
MLLYVYMRFPLGSAKRGRVHWERCFEIQAQHIEWVTKVTEDRNNVHWLIFKVATSGIRPLVSDSIELLSVYRRSRINGISSLQEFSVVLIKCKGISAKPCDAGKTYCLNKPVRSSAEVCHVKTRRRTPSGPAKTPKPARIQRASNIMIDKLPSQIEFPSEAKQM